MLECFLDVITQTFLPIYAAHFLHADMDWKWRTIPGNRDEFSREGCSVFRAAKKCSEFNLYRMYRQMFPVAERARNSRSGTK